MGEQPPIASTPRRPNRPAEPGRPRNPIADNAPWKPTPYGEEEAGAAKALFRGEAKPHQQQLFLDWLINIASGTYDESYRPGEEGRRDTDYALGKANVGRTVVKMIKVNIQPKRR